MEGVGIILLILIGSSMSLPYEKPKTNDPLIENLNELPESEKESFLSYFLAIGVAKKTGQNYFMSSASAKDMVAIPYGLGIDDQEIMKFKAMDIPDSSIYNLLEWTKRQFNLNETEIMELAYKKRFCDINGCCTNLIPDVGVICCPW